MNCKILILVVLIQLVNLSKARIFEAQLDYFDKVDVFAKNDVIQCVIKQNITKFVTSNHFDYFFHAPESKNTTFLCQSRSNCLVLLSNKIGPSPHSVKLHLDLNKDNIFYQEAAVVVKNKYDNKISNYGFKHYWIDWVDNIFKIGLVGEAEAFLIFNQKDFLIVNYLSFVSGGTDNVMSVPDLESVTGHSPPISSKIVTSNCWQLQGGSPIPTSGTLKLINWQYDYVDRINKTYLTYKNVTNINKFHIEWFSDVINSFHDIFNQNHYDIINAGYDDVDKSFIEEHYLKRNIYNEFQVLYDTFKIDLLTNLGHIDGETVLEMKVPNAKNTTKAETTKKPEELETTSQ
jgi:hypothetical protein